MINLRLPRLTQDLKYQDFSEGLHSSYIIFIYVTS
jgi:hypothetical protein